MQKGEFVMSFKFIEANDVNREQYLDYIAEWKRHGGKIVPASSDPKGETFEQMLEKWSDEKSDKMYERGLVPASTYFLVDEKGKIYGSLNFRYSLNDYLLKVGGHIGYGVRPSERKKGYASVMLEQALLICRAMGLKKVLITCDDHNVGSAKTIEKCGGILENEIEDNGTIKKRYWITL